jgi:uncharacterized protein with HEPN domain
MPSEKVVGYIKDILHHIDLATEFVGGLTAQQFGRDVLRVYAVTRCLEIISEASRRLPTEIKDRHPISLGAIWQGLGTSTVTTMTT